jgi:class III poly(R)-hydroxyalkanoic acid synthase PhaE subunit
MHFGADLFLQMMRGIFPGYLDESTEKYREWFQKSVLAMDSEIQSNLMQRILQNGDLYVKFMNTALEASEAAWAGEGSDEKLNEIFNKVTQHYLEFYQESVGKYLAAPQFGIPRETLQQINIAISAYHKFMGAVGDFLIRFSTPFKKSMDILQQTILDRERTDEGFKNTKEVYNFAVKIFEQEYDDWLKSPAGVQCVANMVDNYLEYRKKLNPVKDIWLKSLSIPTKREMEDVYRGIYDLKKKTRKQDALIREQNETIKSLTRKLQTFEASLPGALSKKKPSASSVAQRRTESKASTRTPRKAKSSRKAG